jgi:hypothetical protein
MPTFKDFNIESGEERAEEVIYGQALESPPAGSSAQVIHLVLNCFRE